MIPLSSIQFKVSGRTGYWKVIRETQTLYTFVAENTVTHEQIRVHASQLSWSRRV